MACAHPRRHKAWFRLSSGDVAHPVKPRKPLQLFLPAGVTMQTFITEAPGPDGFIGAFVDTARTLDWRRLGKQRVEARQILAALEGRSKGWINHPAVKMWRGYESALRIYHDVMCKQWEARGYMNNLWPLAGDDDYLDVFLRKDEKPWWLNERLAEAHRSNLIRKQPGHYRSLWPNTPDNLPYIWPTGRVGNNVFTSGAAI